jgi:hypothetical protein
MLVRQSGIIRMGWSESPINEGDAFTAIIAE